MILDPLTEEEKVNLDNWIFDTQCLEILQAMDLINNCNITFQFAKTHSVFVGGLEKDKQDNKIAIENNKIDSGISSSLLSARLEAYDIIISRKLKLVRIAFRQKFGLSIFKYLGRDGKTKKIW